MDPDNVKTFFFLEDLFEASLRLNFNVTYKFLRKRHSNAHKHISPNAFAAINDVVRGFLWKYDDFITDIILNLRRLGYHNIYVPTLGEFYLIETGFSWSKLRKFIGMICAVATFCYVEELIHLSDELLNSLTAFMGSKLFGNSEKFIGWQAFEENCADYVLENKHTFIVGSLKQLEDLNRDLDDMLEAFLKSEISSGIFRPEKFNTAISSQESSDTNYTWIQLYSDVSTKPSRPHTVNHETPLNDVNVGVGLSTVNRCEPVVEQNSTSDHYIPQQCVKNPVPCGIAGNISYDQTPPIINNDVDLHVEEALTEQFIFCEVLELENLVRSSLKIMSNIRNRQVPRV